MGKNYIKNCGCKSLNFQLRKATKEDANKKDASKEEASNQGASKEEANK